MHSSIATTSPSPGYARTKQLARTANMAERISSDALTHRALALNVRINYNAVNTIINTCISRSIMLQGLRPFVLGIIAHALKVHCFSTAILETCQRQSLHSVFSDRWLYHPMLFKYSPKGEYPQQYRTSLAHAVCFLQTASKTR